MILALKTDSPTAELILLSGDGDTLERRSWLAERRLARELLSELDELLVRNHSSWAQLSGLVVYKGPGSFTGLRIGITVMNTVAYSQHIPIVGETGDQWCSEGIRKIIAGTDEQIVLPEYGAPARITSPRK